MITINKLIANSIVITTGPVDDGKTRVKYTASIGIQDWEGDIVGELSYESIPYKENAEIVEIGSHVTSIGDYAFQYCGYIKSVTIPDGVTSIGDNAFEDCGWLTSMTMPDSMTSIGWNAFYNCIGLTSVTIPDSVTSIGYDAFYNCSDIATVTIKSNGGNAENVK